MVFFVLRQTLNRKLPKAFQLSIPETFIKALENFHNSLDFDTRNYHKNKIKDFFEHFNKSYTKLPWKMQSFVNTSHVETFDLAFEEEEGTLRKLLFRWYWVYWYFTPMFFFVFFESFIFTPYPRISQKILTFSQNYSFRAILFVKLDQI